MNDSPQQYEEIVQLISASPKGVYNLYTPFVPQRGLRLQPYEKFVRLTGTWRKGRDKLSRPFVAPQRAHSIRDDSSRISHVEHVLDMPERPPAP